METKICIIVPVYKAEKFLHRCVDSILNQTFHNFELLLIDDGSPDNSGAICDEYAACDKRIHVIHKENCGVAAARNTGIEWVLDKSESQYLTFIDSDDWVHPQLLEILLHSLQVSGAELSMVGSSYIDVYFDNSKKIMPLPEPECFSGEELFISREWDFNYPWGKLYRKQDFRNLRYPEGKIFEDVFTTYKLIFAANKIALADVAVYFYFRNEEGICHSPWKPRELVIFESMEQQLAFFKSGGYLRAYEKEHRLYLNHFAYQIARIRDNKADFIQNRPYIKPLRMQMMRIIRESGGKYNHKNMPQCYAAAYPWLTECHRLLTVAIKTLKESGLAGVLNKVREVKNR